MSRSSAKDAGHQSVIPGTVERYATSKTPWCVSPSSPTSPARSTPKTTCSPSSDTSCISWSYARCKKLEYIAATGSMPCLAIPAAMATV